MPVGETYPSAPRPKKMVILWIAAIGLLLAGVVVLTVALTQHATQPEPVKKRPGTEVALLPKEEVPAPPPAASGQPARPMEVEDLNPIEPPRTPVRKKRDAEEEDDPPAPPLPANPPPAVKPPADPPPSKPPADPPPPVKPADPPPVVKPPPDPAPAEPPKVKPPDNPPPADPPKVKPPAVPPPPPPPPERPRITRPPRPPRLPTVELNDPAQKPLLVLDPGGHTAQAWTVLFTPDGRQVVSVSGDKTVRVLDAQTGDTVRIFHLPAGAGNEGALFTGALAPDGQRLAVGGITIGQGEHEHLIYLLDLDNGDLERVLGGNRASVESLAFSADGKYLASGALDGKARLHDPDSGKLLKVLEGGHRDKIRRVAFSPDGRLLATLSSAAVCLWSVPDGDRVGVLADGGKHPLSLAWSPDGSFLATGSVDGFIHLWGPDGAYRQGYPVLPTEKVQVVSLACSPNGKELLYTGVNRLGHAGIFELETGRARPFTGHSNTVLFGSLSADGRLAVTTGGDNHETFVWQTADGGVVQKIQGAGRAVWAVGWAPDGKTIAWGTTNYHDKATGLNALEQTFSLADLEIGETLSTPETPREEALRAGPDYQRDRHSAFWQLERVDHFAIAVKQNGKQVGVFRSPYEGDRIYSYSLLTESRAVFGSSYGLFLVDLQNGKRLRSFRGHNGMIFAIAPSPNGKYFLTGCSDETMRIWSPDQAEPLLSLFMAGRDWIAWTPEGYYAASACGERLMGWQVNHGADQLASYFPAGQFRPSLYNPDLIKLVVPEGGTKPALARLDKGDKNVVNVSQVLPPVAIISSPSPGKLDKARQEVKGVARSVGANPVTAMRLLVDGRPWQGDRGVKNFAEAKAGEVRASWDVDLPAGQHTLAVQAESAVSKGMSETVEVTVPGGDGKQPNLYVVAVGISDYPEPLTLHYAAKDARVLSEVLRDKGRGVFGSVEVKLILDREATRRNIEEGVSWLAARMTPKDVGVLSFSGHGMRDRQGRFYLVPVDVKDEDPAGTCVSGDALKKQLGNIPGRLLAILDACHSGAAAGGKPAPRAQADDLARDLVSDDYGVVVMAASLGSECALEGPQAGHGFFTLGLVEALGGKADFNRDRLIHLNEVDVYARFRVRQLSRGQQNPVTGKPPTVRSFPLAGLNARPPQEKPPEPEKVKPAPEKDKPVVPGSSPAALLANELVRSSGAERSALFQRLRDTKGPQYTEALTLAIPHLEEEGRQKAREALTQRLARFTPETLVRYLGDEEPEIRRAAALACAARELKGHIPKLIPLLRDREAVVAQAAHQALKDLSGQTLSPAPDGWEAWWKTQGKE